MKTINGWTKEKMITYIKTEFKGKSVDDMDNNVCLYRGPNGKKCAVGMFIPDSKYDPKMEGPAANYVFCKFGLAPFMPLTVDEMMDLQLVHDMSEPENTLSEMLDWIEENVEEEEK